MPNVEIFFNHKLTGADFRNCKAWFEVQGTGKATGRAREIEVDFDLMIGADGAHSSVRYHMMKYVRMNYLQEYIDTLWCEFQLQPRQQSGSDPEFQTRFQISPHHLHIWPGKDFMFIAIPSEVSRPIACRPHTDGPGWLLYLHTLHVKHRVCRVGGQSIRSAIFFR